MSHFVMLTLAMTVLLVKERQVTTKLVKYTSMLGKSGMKSFTTVKTVLNIRFVIALAKIQAAVINTVLLNVTQLTIICILVFNYFVPIVQQKITLLFWMKTLLQTLLLMHTSVIEYIHNQYE